MAEVTEEKKRISELPETTDFTGLYTIGSKSVGDEQQSFKVSLEGVKNATNAANTAAINATAAASNANAKAALAEEKATLAATKAAAADSAATAASAAASAANTAAGSATSAAEEAEDAASAASAAADRVDEVIETANADHEQAATDHETAVADHEQAEADHEKIERKSDKDGYTPSQRVGSADDVVLGEREWSEEEIPFRRSGCPYERGNAVVRGAKGRSMAWNQLVTNGDFSQGTTGWTAYQCSIAASGGILTGTVTTKSNGIQIYRTNFNHPVNHYYYCNIVVKSSRATTISVGLVGSLMVIPDTAIGADTWAPLSGIIKATTAPVELSIYLSKTNALEVGDAVSVRSINFIDLTLLYGAGKEPTSVAEFVRTFPNLYYPHNAGKLIHNAANRIESVGRNVWDEEWESGTLNNTTGEEASSTTDIRSKNYIPVIAEEYYYFKSEAQVQAYGYDASHNFIGRIYETAYNLANTKIQIPAGYSYIRLRIVATTYNHDICVNRSDFRNGLYTPYEKSVATIRFDAFKVKDANGNVLTVNGLKSAGTVFDEIDIVRRKYIKRVGTADMGTLTFAYNSSNMFATPRQDGMKSSANALCTKYTIYGTSAVNMPNGYFAIGDRVLSINDTSKSASDIDGQGHASFLDDVMLNYELATPVEYDLVDDINGYYKATSLGTEASAPLTDATGNPISLPFTGELGYGQNIGEQMDDKTGQNDYAPALVAGSADGLLGVSKAQEFTFAAVPEGTGNGAARIGKVKGNSLAWNQLVVNGNFAQGVLYWSPKNGTFTANDGILTYTVVTPDNGPSITKTNFPDIANHKYLFAAELNYSANPADANTGFLGIGGYYGVNWPTNNIVPNSWFKVAGIVTSTGVSPYKELRVYFRTNNLSAGATIQIKNVVAFDLTLMFGAGKEPSTVAEFEALYPELYYPQNDGTIINNDADTLVTDGFNQWDEEAQVGNLSTTDGSEITDTMNIRSGYMPAIPGAAYYVNSPKTLRFWWYDSNKSSISGGTATVGSTQVAPSNARYFRFGTTNAYGPTYQNDICISRSDPARNGQFEHHWRRTLPLALTSLRGRLNGTGERVAIFPDGMKRAGDAYDEVYGNIAIKRVGSVDLGTLTWGKVDVPDSFSYFRAGIISKRAISGVGNSNLVCSKYCTITRRTYASILDKSIMEPGGNTAQQNIAVRDSAYSDAATFVAAMNGVMLNYELATPEIYILDEPIPSGFAVGAGGTMRALPDAIDGTPTAPFSAEIAFPRDNYGITSKNSTVALLEALKTAGKIASYTIGYDANGDMTFNIT